jgi:hypothetical protein
LGPRSETLSDLQLQLLADEEPGITVDEVEAEARRAPLTDAPPRQRRPHPGRQRLPENLPRVEEVVPCAVQTCGKCGAATSVIGYDESEQLDVQPARHAQALCRNGQTSNGTPVMASISGVSHGQTPVRCNRFGLRSERKNLRAACLSHRAARTYTPESRTALGVPAGCLRFVQSESNPRHYLKTTRHDSTKTTVRLGARAGPHARQTLTFAFADPNNRN